MYIRVTIVLYKHTYCCSLFFIVIHCMVCASLFVLDMGTILKVVCIPRGSWHDLEEVLLEEMTVFRVRFFLVG